MSDYSKLVSMKIFNLGCIGPEGLEVKLDDILCLVGSNNAGKSTVLRAYELAARFGALRDGERSALCPEDDCPAVELLVHIPAGMANIAEKWKEPVGNLLLVKSRWDWKDPKKPERRTWDPELQDYSKDKNAGGLDSVFSSRLPKPLRVGALDSPAKEQEAMLGIVLDRVIEGLNEAATTSGTELRNAIDALVDTARHSISDLQKNVKEAASQVNQEFKQVFPNLTVDLRVDIPDMPIEMGSVLKKGSSLEVVEGEVKSKWDQLGTGSQRALFWSLLGVRSRLEAIRAASSKGGKTTKSRQGKAATSDEAPDIKLPGHMLLIDEPEIALHPSAIRAARRYLYDLAKDEGWQVMLTTHSPLFIDPTEDHTTIVRLDRTGDRLSPQTFQSSASGFDGDDREQLKMLLKFDSGLAEMFFGGFPIVVEGDTEFAAFEAIMELHSDGYPVETRPLIIRARGKDTILPILKIFRQFKIPFAVLHGSDTPKTSKGKKNSAWSANALIHAEIVQAFSDGQNVSYSTSVPNFEEQHDIPPVDKDKPWNTVKAIRSDAKIALSVRKVLDDLLGARGGDPTELNEALVSRVNAWGAANAKDDPRFEFSK